VSTVRLLSMVAITLEGVGLLSAPRTALAYSSTDQVAAVSARASSDYVRPKLADGSFKPEYYAFGEGGHWTGANRDPSMDGLRFIDVAKAIAGPLQERNYMPTSDPKATKLLILVYWGKTRTPGSVNDSQAVQNLEVANEIEAASKSAQNEKLIASNVAPSLSGPLMVCGRVQTVADNEQVTDRIDSENTSTSAMAVVSAENHQRDQLDAQNATMLGYDAAWGETAGLEGTPLEHRRTELVQEIEEERYFVVLMAYDFQLMWKEKKHKLLWETRFSVPRRSLGFDKYLVAMTQQAARYFGRNSHNLEHVDMPVGRVDVGDIKSLGVVLNK